MLSILHSNPGESLLDALKRWDNNHRANCDYSFHMAVTWWGEQVFNEMEPLLTKGALILKHFLAYKGALMVNDDELFSSFNRLADLGATPMVHAENGDVITVAQAFSKVIVVQRLMHIPDQAK